MSNPDVRMVCEKQMLAQSSSREVYVTHSAECVPAAATGGECLSFSKPVGQTCLNASHQTNDLPSREERSQCLLQQEDGASKSRHAHGICMQPGVVREGVGLCAVDVKCIRRQPSVVLAVAEAQ